MSYRAGIGLGFEQWGLYPEEPHIICDGCGRTKSVYNKNGDVSKWFLNRKPSPGWTSTRNMDGNTTTDYCPECRGNK